MVTRGTAVKAIALLVLLAGGAAGTYVYQVGSDFQSPQVESMSNEFGAVTEESTTVESRIVVQNPNNESIPGAAQVKYGIRMNGIEMGEGKQGGIGLDPGRNEITLTASLDNDKIPAWWVTHVNRGERTRLTVSPSVSFTGLPLDTELPAQNRTIRTDLLGAFDREEPQSVTLNNETVMTISNQSARWGEANAERTPIVVNSTVESAHDHPIQLDGTAYRVKMNGVVVGNGTTNDSLALAPGETETFTVRPSLETPKMQAWWVSHLRNNQTTQLSVQVYGLVEKNGTTQQVPISVFGREARIHSDFLGTGETTVESLGGDRGTQFRQPTLAGTESHWGEVHKKTTDIETKLTVENPNDAEFGDLISLTVRQSSSIHGVPVADGGTTTSGLNAGTNTLSLTSEFRHSTVPVWWAHHLNAGEESTVNTRTNATVDVGVTTLNASVPDRQQTLTTDLLAGFNDTSDRAIEQNGRRVATIHETSATWGHATEHHAPIDAQVTIENERSRAIEIRDITYTVTLNGVALADNRTVDEEYDIPPLATKTIEPTFVLNNTKMEEWWPTHVRNGETSQLRTEVYATVDTPLGSQRIELESFGQNRTVTTELF